MTDKARKTKTNNTPELGEWRNWGRVDYRMLYDKKGYFAEIKNNKTQEVVKSSFYNERFMAFQEVVYQSDLIRAVENL